MKPPGVVTSCDVVVEISRDKDITQEPVPLTSRTPVSFPSEIFPDWFAAMIKAVSISTETPLEMAAMIGLAVAATGVQQKIEVTIKKGYQEPLCIWTLTLMESGNRKSSVVKQMTKVIKKAERELLLNSIEGIREAKEKALFIDEQIDKLRNDRKKSKAGTEQSHITNEIIKLESSKPAIPHPPRIWSQDITPEKLGDLMSNQNEKMSIISPEGGVFEIMAGRYSGGVPNIDIFLQAHAGDSVRVDRGSRDPVFMDSPTLTMGISPQPSGLRNLSNNRSFKGKGLLSRFLYALPATLMGSRTFDTDPVPDDISMQYEEKMMALIGLKQHYDDGKIIPQRLKFDNVALADWTVFALEIEEMMKDGGQLEFIRDWAGKLPGATARIAGLIHCMEYAGGEPWRAPVSADTVKNAVKFSRVLIVYAERVFDEMGCDEGISSARKVLKWIDRERAETFTFKNCFDALKGTFKRTNEMDPAFAVLEERHYIELVKAEGKRPPGRPSRKYIVNPYYAKQWT